MTTKSILRFLSVAAAVGLLAGCANNAAIRSLASLTATAASDYAAATTDFAKTQTSIAGYDAERLRNLRSTAANIRGETDLLNKSWALGGDKARSDRFKTATSAGAAELTASLSPPAAAAGGPKRGGVDLSEPIKLLREIATEPDLLSQAVFLGEYHSAVQAEVEKLQKKAEDEAKAQGVPPPG